ncbi:MAG: phosphate ABC transporter permease subunit PstC [Acetobacteraceae bacterium]
MRFRLLLATLAGVLPVVLVLIVLFIGVYAWPAIRFNGMGFVVRDFWSLGNLYADPITVGGVSVQPGAQYGILFLIVGTLLTTLIAMVIALPIGVGAAVFLAEAVPGRLRLWLSIFVELLAAIPSVVYGLWGYVVLIPFLGHHLYPAMARLLGFLPPFGGATGSGYGLLTAGLVLSLMIVPLIAVTLRDALVAQPIAVREAAMALGATRFEMVWRALLPATRLALVGAAILATGRALGETMAVLMVSGNALNYLPHNIYAPVTTMASFIVSQLDSALQDPTEMAVRSLAEIALLLALIAIAVNALARVLLRAGTVRGRHAGAF